MCCRVGDTIPGAQWTSFNVMYREDWLIEDWTSRRPGARPRGRWHDPGHVAGEPATWRDYLGTVTDSLGV